jgi:hypothetical protein
MRTVLVEGRLRRSEQSWRRRNDALLGRMVQRHLSTAKIPISKLTFLYFMEVAPIIGC